MKNFLLRWIINIAALFIVVYVAGGISVDSWQTVVAAAFILGLLNAFLRPILVLLTLPFNILTLGFFTFVINGFIFYLTAKFVKGFSVIDFWSAFWAAILFSIVSFFISLFIGTRGQGPGASINFYKTNSNTTKDDDIIDVEGHVEK